MVLGDKRWTVSFVCDEILRELGEYERWLGDNVAQPMLQDSRCAWKPPPVGYVSLMTDEAYSTTHDCMGMGGLVRDDTGTWLGGFYAGSAGGDPLYAEMQALLMGLTFAWNKNCRKIICSSDCLELVRMVGKQGVDFHQYSRLLMDLHLLLARNWAVQVRYMPREGNAPADFLAGMGARLQCALVALDSPPEEVVHLLQKDLLAL